MYVKTENQEIINLDQYQRVVVEESLVGNNPPVRHKSLIAVAGNQFGNKSDCIATFDTEEVAAAALDDLFRALTKGDPTWNASLFKTNYGVLPVRISAVANMSKR